MQIPKELRYVPFMKPYDPPPPAAQDAERPPEVIEAEMKALEEAMEALALVTLKSVAISSLLSTKCKLIQKESFRHLATRIRLKMFFSNLYQMKKKDDEIQALLEVINFTV